MKKLILLLSIFTAQLAFASSNNIELESSKDKFTISCPTDAYEAFVKRSTDEIPDNMRILSIKMVGSGAITINIQSPELSPDHMYIHIPNHGGCILTIKEK